MERIGHSMFLLRPHSRIYLHGWISSQDADHLFQRNHILIRTCILSTHSYSPPPFISISTAWVSKFQMQSTIFSGSLISLTQRITAILIPSSRYVSIVYFFHLQTRDWYIFFFSWCRLAGTLLLSASAVWWTSLLVMRIRWSPMPTLSSTKV